MARQVGMEKPARLASENVVISAPMSFTGSAQRVWKITRQDNPVAHWLLIIAAVFLIPALWFVIACWYVVFGLILFPYRILRRGSRKRKRQSLQHRETLAAIERQGKPQ